MFWHSNVESANNMGYSTFRRRCVTFISVEAT